MKSSVTPAASDKIIKAFVKPKQKGPLWSLSLKVRLIIHFVCQPLLPDFKRLDPTDSYVTSEKFLIFFIFVEREYTVRVYI